MYKKDPVIEYIVQNLKGLSPKQIILFGSRARGDFKERSDYDLAVVGANPKEWAKTILDIQEFSPTLCGFDIVNLDEASPKFKARILQEGIIIYESKT